MQSDWLPLVIVALAIMALVFFLFKTNHIDKKVFEHNMNEDYRKPKEREPEID